ncbi:MAG: thermonuclease family protein [Alphaproteobacteria bacterium]|nr:thermonuclease family protein [Alphaproteobacteria bacterium]
MTVCGSGHRYACVVDGDTLWLDGQKIRLADINTPETHGARCAEERALGERATLRLVELINAGPFELVSDGGRDRDRYGRKLRLLKRDGQSLGLVLVAEGLAHVWAGYRQDWCA